MASLRELSELSKSNPRLAYEEAIEIAGKQAERLDAIYHESFGWIMYRYCMARLNELVSIQGRRLLRDYLLLKNKRPSILHSLMLSFAIQFSKMHHNFKFSKFFQLWGIENLRIEDLNDQEFNGKAIPSLLYRVCTRLSESDTLLLDETAQATGLPLSTIIDLHRRHWFIILHRLHKYRHNGELWEHLQMYAIKYGAYQSTKWHSEIIKYITQNVDDKHALQYIEFVIACKDTGFISEDFVEEIGKRKKSLPPPAAQLANRCYEFANSHQLLQADRRLLNFLIELYDSIELHGIGDDTHTLQRSVISNWFNSLSGSTTNQ